MIETVTSKRISRRHARNPADATWRALSAQVAADIDGLNRDADADRMVARMDAAGIEPRAD